MHIRTKFAVAAAALTALAATAAPARAQGLGAFGIAAGASVPTGDLGKTQSTGFHATVIVGAQPPLMPVGFRAEGSYNQFTTKSDAISIPGFPRNDLRVLSLTGNVILSAPGVLARPYVIGGLGYYNLNFKDSNIDSEGKFGFNAGIGAKFSLTGFSTFAEVRYHRVSTDNSSLSYVPITFGIMF